MNDLSPDDVIKAAKDSLYVSVGLGVIAFQRAQVRRHELTKQLDEARSGGISKAVGDNLKMVEERVADAEARIDAVLDDVETKLPDPAREAMSAARSAAKEAREQLHKLIG